MIKKRHYIIAAALMMLVIIIGSFVDEDLTAYFFNIFNNKDAHVFKVSELLIVLPAYLFMSVMGYYLTIRGFKSKNINFFVRFSCVFFGIFGSICAAFFIGNQIKDCNFNNFLNKFYVAYPIGIAVVAAFGTLGIPLEKKCESRYLPYMFILILFVGGWFLFFFPQLFKAIFHRPRYRVLVYQDLIDFHNWWEPCWDYKDYLTLTITKEEFKSLPSGHTACAAYIACMLPLLGEMFKKLKKFQVPLFYIGLGYVSLTCVFRLMQGAHYLSDTGFGGLIVFIGIIIIKICYEQYIDNKLEKVERKKQNKVEG